MLIFVSLIGLLIFQKGIAWAIWMIIEILIKENLKYFMRAIEWHKKLPSIEGNGSDICKAFVLKSVRQFYIFGYSYCKIKVFLINNL